MIFYKGVDTASDVADLVAKAFSNNLNSAPKSNTATFDDTKERQDLPPLFTDNQPGPGLISNLLRIMGLDSGKIGALAVNGIIFIAQMVRGIIGVANQYFRNSLSDWKLIFNFLADRVENNTTAPEISFVDISIPGVTITA